MHRVEERIKGLSEGVVHVGFSLTRGRAEAYGPCGMHHQVGLGQHVVSLAFALFCFYR